MKRSPATVRVAPWLGLLVVFVSLTLGSSFAWAHPYAVSQASIRSQKDGVAVGFQFDATSVVDLVKRQRPEAKEVDKASLEPYGSLLLDYVAKRFRVSNDGKLCERDSPASAPKLWLESRTNKVPLSMRYRCSTTPAKLRIESELWRDEKTPHKVAVTVRHERAAERFFLTKTKGLIKVELARLVQPGSASSATVAASAVDPSIELAEAPKSTTSDADNTAPKASFVEFVRQGVVHIFGGLDHVLFVIVLVLAARSWRELALVVTSFTIAHSITIGLTALELVRVAPILVEPIIAASIVYVAVENVLRDEPRHRLRVTFGFGLVHGLGFGSVLLDLGIAGQDVIPLLLGFNVGVELGQLAIVLPLFAIVRYLQKIEWRHYPRLRSLICGFVALAGCFWVVERIMG